MKNLFLISFLFVSANLSAQCKKGNCINGTGTYDFSWCLYIGEFKNGKPEGKGSMKYGDYIYNGSFINGLEDGDGEIVKKDGTKEIVVYEKGVKQVNHLVKVKAEDYQPLSPQDVNCISGDCINGYGTYIFPGGNKYVGNRVNYRMDGNGIFYFANGDKLEGIFKNNIPNSGTYIYISGAKYKGTYDDKGLELNGSITSPTGISIPYVNGKPIIPPKPKIEEIQKQNNNTPVSRERIKTTCSVCFGRGSQRRTEYWGGSQLGLSLMSVPVTCYKCFGKGVE